MKNLALVLIGLVIVAGGVYYYTTMNKTTPNSMMEKSDTMAEPTQSVVENAMPVPDSTGSAEMEAVQTVTMDAGSFYYSVEEIKAKVGDTIKIIMTSKDMMHNFNLDEFNVQSATAKAGETVEFEFTVDKAGVFEYYCSVGQHRANGQVGTLIVE